MSITRRLFLRNSAAAGAVAATVAAPAVAVAATPMTPREQAIWHIRELKRLVLEDGAIEPVIIVSGSYGPGDHGMMSINIGGNFVDHGDLFRGGKP